MRLAHSRLGKHASLLAAVLLLSATAAACGSDSESGTDGDSAGSEETFTWSSHEDLVAAAEGEKGPLRAQLKLDPEVYEPIVEAFNKVYPNIKVQVSEFPSGNDQKFALELQSGSVDTDIMYTIAQSASYFEIAPYTDDRVDLLQMVEDGVLDIPKEAIDPKHPSLVAPSSGLGGTAFNPKLIDKEDVPNWEGFTDPKWKGQFMTNLDAANITFLRTVKGDDWVDKYLADIKANDPIFIDSDTAGLTRLMAGEFPLALATNYYSALRLKAEDPENIDVIVPDPVPNHITNLQGVFKEAKNRAQAVLFMEFIFTKEAQGILDEKYPANGCLCVEGTLEHDLVEGKTVATLDWTNVEKIEEWNKKAQEIWGFPTVD